MGARGAGYRAHSSELGPAKAATREALGTGLRTHLQYGRGAVRQRALLFHEQRKQSKPRHQAPGAGSSTGSNKSGTRHTEQPKRKQEQTPDTERTP